MAKIPNGVEKLQKISTAWLGRTSVTGRWQMDRRDDRQTDDRRTGDSM